MECHVRMRVRATILAATLTTAAGMTAPAGAEAADRGRPAGTLPAVSVKNQQARALAAADRAVADEVGRFGSGMSPNRRTATRGGDGLHYVAYEQTYRGRPVIGADGVVVVDGSGRIHQVQWAAGARARMDVLPAEPVVNATAAIRTARSQLARVSTSTTAREVVLARTARPVLAWETVVTGRRADGTPSRLHVYIDAQTGRIADRYDEVRSGSGTGYYYGQVAISTSGSGGSWSMTDPTRSGIRCGGQSGTAFTGTDDVWGTGSGTNLETACVDALYGVQKEWDMLAAWLGRNGINGSGGGYPARVGMTDVNAYWTGSYATFGRTQDGVRQMTSIDVVAHEFGHAIFQFTPGGAGSGNENGGINEGTGDIFGALTEHYANNVNDPPDYLVGEEVNLAGTGEIRNMYNPSAEGHPNCYTSSIPNTEVHAAAGPLNHWFYLLAEGSNPGGGKPSSPICAGGPSSVTGIGIQKAGRIFMGALNRKTSTWRYANVRSASVAAAVDLYGAGSAECAATKAAWSAVSVAAQAGEPGCTSPGNNFTLSLNPVAGSVRPGESVTATVSTQTSSGSAQPVTLTATGLPTGATASFNPAVVTSGESAALTIATGTTTSAGTYPIAVTGTGTTVTHTATFTLTVGGGGTFSVVVDGPSSASTAWGTSTFSSQRYGTDYRFADPVAASDPAWFRANLPATGSYLVEVWYPASDGYNSATPYVVATATGNQTITVDQRLNGGHWVALGTFTLNGGDRNVVAVSRWTSTSGYVIADAVRITRQ
ncbi:M4 family metallopeptidase [Micromonospora sp. NPDC051141]|uniref:golvesin C-terminal-like domain-containing protein n=1 Tax=Micromonospora sp. NPDC051141 TaxID=3364284 RepID=UPI00378971FF